MKKIAFFLTLVFCSTTTVSAEVKKVYLQVEGCLRTTCSRKVWQALGRSVQSSSFKVDDAADGIAEFIPATNAPLNLRALNKRIHDAGYRVRRVAIEVEGTNPLQVSKLACAQESLPELWLIAAKTQRVYQWSPSAEDLKKATDGDVQVCPVQ